MTNRLLPALIGLVVVGLCPMRAHAQRAADTAVIPDRPAADVAVPPAESAPGTNELNPPPDADPAVLPPPPNWQGGPQNSFGALPGEVPPGAYGAACYERMRIWHHFFGPTINGRHRGLGNPLERESWINRPYSIGFLTGGFFPGDPVTGKADGNPAYIVGGRVGWDGSHFWGLESRFAFSTFGLNDPRGISVPGNVHSFLWDTDFLYYPWGDAQWRPYALIGFGLGDFQFEYDTTGSFVHETALLMPFGGGFKYHYSSLWAFRVDIIDNLSFRTGQISTMNSLSVTGGIESRFGGAARKNYWPWNSSKSWY
jgi:hypothetical protein